MATTLFTTQTPDVPEVADVDYELGMKFQASAAGDITAVRYWRSPNDSVTHVGRIWSAAGVLLASVTFTGESASGWQEQALGTPLSIAADTTYVVSVNVAGFYPYTAAGLASQISNNELRSVADGANGVFNTTPGSFPTNAFNDTNYFRDVVFESATAAHDVAGDDADATGDADAPTLTQTHALAGEAASATGETEGAGLTQTHALGGQEADATAAADAPALGHTHALGVEEATSDPIIDAPSVSQSHVLASLDADAFAASDSPALPEVPEHDLTPAELVALGDVDTVSVAQTALLGAADVQAFADADTPGWYEAGLGVATDLQFIPLAERYDFYDRPGAGLDFRS